ncbi:ATP-binding protein [Aurantiacibacter poecillastricola]|uniref:ATP-binding protein n=1 Tax=Aurantiacibacter poecillastricola TaxID=3064385 RepID=UPI00273EDEB9|nr:ATP-binding protein [Aurantiacibacter sp. 219JJ12-13]MDP5261286.1 ATP-binding protein [Aurantiacibacter sp. 219JJ12-13]
MAFPGARKIATIELRTDRDVAKARSRVSEIMKAKGSRDLMTTRFVTAVSEIARNAATHGKGGRLLVYDMPDPRLIGVECVDEGSGIEDVERAMVDGYSTRQNSLGRGLGGAKRLAKTFTIESTPGKGTVVRMTGICTTR